MHSKTSQPIGFRSQIQKKVEIKSLGKNYNCDLGKEACESTLPDKTKIKVSFTPRPIKVEKSFSINIESNSKKYVPESVDFVGVDQNMGLIRPKIKNSKAVVTLPLCESTSMNWVIRLIVKDYKSQLYFLEYSLLTSN